MDAAAWAGVIIGILAIGAAFLIYLLQRSRKVIAYQIITDTEVLSIREEEDVKRKVEILFDKKPIRDVHVVTLRVWNSGNTPIKREDYDQNVPIELEFGKEAEILEADIVETKPNSIEADIRASLNFGLERVSIAPGLLNPEDSIKIKMLITKFRGGVNIGRTRIVGGKFINWNNTFYGKFLKQEKIDSLVLASFIMVICIISWILIEVIGGLIVTTFHLPPYLTGLPALLLIFGVGGAVAGIFFLILEIFKPNWYIRQKKQNRRTK